MYEIRILTDDLRMMDVSDTEGNTILFNTDEEAWDFVSLIMQNPTRPRFAWVKKGREERSSLFSQP